MSQFIWCNGEPLTTPLDRGLQFGDGHFTTLRVSDGRPLWWQQHLARLQLANQRLGLPELTDNEAQQLFRLAAEGDDAVVKIIITRGNGARGYAPNTDSTPNHYLIRSPLPAISSVVGNMPIADLRLGHQPVLAGLKTLNRLEHVLLAQERQQRQVDDLLVLDCQQHVIAGCQGNVFWRVGQQWYTPELSACGIDGVSRQVILANGWLGEVKVGHFTVEDIQYSEQAFVCNSVRGALPIQQLNGRVLDTQLSESLQQLIL